MQKPIETIKTSDPDQLGEMLLPVLPTDMQFSGLGRKSFNARVKMARLPEMGMFQVQVSQLQAHDCGIRDFISITIPLVGAIDLFTEGQYRQFTQGVAHVAYDRQPLDLKTKSTSCLVLNIDSSYLNRISNKLSGFGEFSLLEICPEFSLQTRKGITFWRFLFNFWSGLNKNPQNLNDGSSVQEKQDNLLSLLLLAMYPDALSLTNNARPRRQAASLKITEEYLCANLEAPISITELCYVAKLHPRTLFRLFKKKHGIGPMAFLKQRRLEAVQRSLMGDSFKSETVTQHAFRFGFNHLGQFSSDYKRAFGESPSKTLSR